MAVVGGLATMFHKERDKQTMGAIVAGAFLISFFINAKQESDLILQIACMVAFAMAVTGGIVTIFSNEGNRRSGAIGIGIVSLGTTLLILFMYLEFRPF
jgi:CHASE2 domain-containing sensor protein